MLSRFSVVLISLAAVTTGNEVSISCEHDDTALLQLQSRGQPKHDPGALSEARNITFDKEFRAGLAQSIQDLKTGLTQAHLEKGAQVSADNFVHNIESVIALFDEEGEKIWDGDDVEGAPAPAEDDGRSLMDNAVDRVHAFKNLVGEDEGVKAVMGILVNQMYGHMRRLGQQGYANSAMNASMPKHKTVKNGKIPMGFVAQGAHALVTSSWPGDMCSMLNFPVLHPIMGALTLPLRFHPMLQIVCWELQFAEGLNMIPTALSGAVASSFALSPFIGMLASGLLTSSASMAGMVKAHNQTLAQSGTNTSNDADDGLFTGVKAAKQSMQRAFLSAMTSFIRAVKSAMDTAGGLLTKFPRRTIAGSISMGNDGTAGASLGIVSPNGGIPSLGSGSSASSGQDPEVNVRVDVHQLSGQKKSSNYAGTSLKGPLGKGVMADIGANQNNGGNFLAFPSPAPIPTSPGQATQQKLDQQSGGNLYEEGHKSDQRQSSSQTGTGAATSSAQYSTVVRVTANQDNSHFNGTTTQAPDAQFAQSGDAAPGPAPPAPPPAAPAPAPPPAAAPAPAPPPAAPSFTAPNNAANPAPGSATAAANPAPAPPPAPPPAPAPPPGVNPNTGNAAGANSPAATNYFHESEAFPNARAQGSLQRQNPQMQGAWRAGGYDQRAAPYNTVGRGALVPAPAPSPEIGSFEFLPADDDGVKMAQQQLAQERMSLEREQQYAQSQPGYKASPEAAKAQQAPNSNNGALQPQEVQSFQQSMNEMEAVPVKISQAASASSKEAAMFNMMHPEKLFGRRKTTPMKESDMYKMMHPKESFAMPSGSTHKGSSEVKPTVAKRLKDELWLTQIT
eukprot:gnl/TRDRNA2_/TRDRNA2_175461_c0_seq16.p1 gnl/TRDRNA2_/TRDRNA2_175461_c0~~gnl/TRDRNA2_/TRDRNA2_175461_c0_seq16.p1  ORF type:complete len:844 (+),score=165.30 gnl/TRDRNA2_/TRDRNA2_175461_c0_seq16:52-2583(+)